MESALAAETSARRHRTAGLALAIHRGWYASRGMSHPALTLSNVVGGHLRLPAAPRASYDRGSVGRASCVAPMARRPLRCSVGPAGDLLSGFRRRFQGV